MTEELKFDVKKLQAMQVPLTVRAVAMRGETQMPLNIPHGSMSQNQAAGTGYTREEVMALEQQLGKSFGGGHYEIGVVDANQSDMRWRIMLDPSIYPGKNSQPPPQMPMGNAPQQMPPPSVQQPSISPAQQQAAQPMQPAFPGWQEPRGYAQPGSSQWPAGYPNPMTQALGYSNNPTWPGQSYMPPNIPPTWPAPFPYWPPPQPQQSNNNSEQSAHREQLLRLELKEALTTQASAFKDEMRAIRDSLQQQKPASDYSGVLDLTKLALPFLPQILGFLNGRQPKEDPNANALKEELRSVKETVLRQEERRAHDAERQQMLQTVEQIQGSMIKELEGLKSSVQDKASSQQVGVLDRVIDAFKGMNADKPVPQGLQLPDIVAILSMVKDAGGNGKGTDLRDTLALFRELAETFGGGGGENPIWAKALDSIGGITQQVIQAKAVQQMRGAAFPTPQYQQPQGVPQPAQIPAQASDGGLGGAPQPQIGMNALISKELHEAVQQLRAGANAWMQSGGKQGVSPASAAQRVKEAADRLMALNFRTDLSTLFTEAKFGELAFQLFKVKEGDYLQEFIETLEEITKMEAVDYGVSEEDEEEGEEEGGDAEEGTVAP